MKTLILGAFLASLACFTISYPYIDSYMKKMHYELILEGKVSRNAGIIG